MWVKRNIWKILVPVLIIAVLAAAFFYEGGGSDPLQSAAEESEEAAQSPADEDASVSSDKIGIRQSDSDFEEEVPGKSASFADDGETSQSPENRRASDEDEESPQSPADEDASASSDKIGIRQSDSDFAEEVPGGSESFADDGETSQSSENRRSDAETQDKYKTDPVPSGKPLPVEPQDAKIGTTAYTCTISISCETILDNMELCDKEKQSLVPDDGWILHPVEVTFYDGESVFNVLRRTCKQLKIHMEFQNTPLYNSAYIEGIGNIYEFDVGDLSGWMYKVNGWFPNYGCSRYQLKDGDVIEWQYTCDLGYDLGGRNVLD